MKLGIKKIQYIHRTKVKDFGSLPAGSTVKLDNFLTDSLSDLPFTPEIIDFLENWNIDDNGRFSEVDITSVVRANKDAHRPTLQKLTGNQHIFVLTLLSGLRYIVGTSSEVPTFSWTDKISGISSSEFAIKIHNKSLHGVFLAV